MSNLDNFEGKSSEELKKILEQGTQEEKVAEEDTPEEDKQMEEKPEAPKEIEEEKENELILGKFKTEEDLVKAYQELEKRSTKVSQELAKAKKSNEPSESKKDDSYDPLWQMIYGQPKSEDKVNTNSYDDIEPDPEMESLREKVEQGEKNFQYLATQQLQREQREKAIETFKNDPLLPWNEEVEKELEATVFTELPNLKYTKGGYNYAYKLLKADKAEEIIKDREEAIKSKAIEKRRKNEAAYVETPESTKQSEDEFDPTKLEDLGSLRKYINKNIGRIER